jgi:5-formyltetrahydrofolate cyclo-ligase
LNLSKKELRQAILASRKRQNISKGSWDELLNLKEIKAATNIGTYLSLPDEPESNSINSQLIAAGKTLYLPKTKADYSMEWVKWGGQLAELSPNNNFSKILLEPVGSPTSLGDLEVLIIPALAIDQNGYRLGRGKGFYDRALSGFQGFRISLIYDEDFIPELPKDEFDQKVDAVLTPTKFFRFNEV